MASITVLIDGPEAATASRRALPILGLAFFAGDFVFPDMSGFSSSRYVWHQSGSRRTQDDLGRTATQPISLGNVSGLSADF
jgi:hypothetical protein